MLPSGAGAAKACSHADNGRCEAPPFGNGATYAQAVTGWRRAAPLGCIGVLIVCGTDRPVLPAGADSPTAITYLYYRYFHAGIPQASHGFEICVYVLQHFNFPGVAVQNLCLGRWCSCLEI